MNKNDLKDLQRLARDVYHGELGNFSAADADEQLREVIRGLVTNARGEVTYNTYKANQYELFAVLEEVLSPIVKPYELPTELAGLITTETVPWGQKATVDVDENSVFDVYVNVDGNADIRRQSISGRTLEVETSPLAIKVYTELKKFLAGDVNFVDLVNRVRVSFNSGVQKRIGALFADITSPLHEQVGAFDPDVLAELIERIEDTYNSEAVIYGRKSVLGKVQDVVISDEYAKQFNDFGYYGSFRGTRMIKVPTTSDKLIIVPYTGSPVAVVVYEGSPIAFDTSDFGQRNDMQLEFFFQQSVGVAKAVTQGITYTIE